MPSITTSYSTVVLDRETKCTKTDGAAFLPTEKVRTLGGQCYYFDEDTVTIFAKSTATIHEIPEPHQLQMPHLQGHGVGSAE